MNRIRRAWEWRQRQLDRQDRADVVRFALVALAVLLAVLAAMTLR